MALIKPSALVSEFKGVLNGSVFQVNPYGNIIRNRKSGSARLSSYFGLSQSIYSQIIRTWRTLTPTEQGDWLTSTASYTFTDKFGNAYTPSAYQLFCTLNFVNVGHGGAVFTSPPTLRTPTNTGAITAATNYTNSLTISWTTAGTSDEFLRVYASPIKSAGRTVQPNSYKWITDVVSGVATQVQLWTAYTTRFGAPVSGQGRIFFKTLNFDERECLLIQPNYISLNL